MVSFCPIFLPIFKVAGMMTIRNVKIKQDDYGLTVTMPRTKVPLIALSLLLMFHAARQCIRKIRKRNCVTEKEQAYPLVPFLLVGMGISVFLLL